VGGVGWDDVVIGVVVVGVGAGVVTEAVVVAGAVLLTGDDIGVVVAAGMGVGVAGGVATDIGGGVDAEAAVVAGGAACGVGLVNGVSIVPFKR
jgi:hypothetical protein